MRGMNFNAANVLTLLRLALSPVFAWMLATSRWIPALVTLAIAIITDVTDGYLARRLKEETAIGKFLDPLSDKVFFGSAIVVLVVLKGLPFYYLLAITRDVLVGVAGIIVLARAEDRSKITFFSSAWGKATTTAQALAVGSMALFLFGAPMPFRVVDFLVLVTFLLGVISSVHYLTTWVRKGYI